jgi:AraC family transcriptional regulator
MRSSYVRHDGARTNSLDLDVGVIRMSPQLLALLTDKNGNSVRSIPYQQVQENGFHLSFKSDPPGLIEEPAPRNTIVAIHYGRSVEIFCRRGGHRHRGTAVHGDIDIIPAGTPSVWDVKEKDTYVALRVPPELLDMVTEEFDIDPGRIEIRNRFQVRDAQLENIAWVLKAEMEWGYPCGRVYLDSLGVSVAARLVACHSSVSVELGKQRGRMSDRKLRRVLSYIEDNLAQDISLRDIATSAGLSVSHLTPLFRETVGLPVHQYLIRRRVERAKELLRGSNMPISQIAFETGFAHQSHLARNMRRVLGVSPRAFRERLR